LLSQIIVYADWMLSRNVEINQKVPDSLVVTTRIVYRTI